MHNDLSVHLARALAADARERAAHVEERFVRPQPPRRQGRFARRQPRRPAIALVRSW